MGGMWELTQPRRLGGTGDVGGGEQGGCLSDIDGIP